MEKTIKVREYSEYPGPRYVEQGEFSGEEFYHTILKNIVEKHLCVISNQEPDWIAMLHNESFLQWEQRRLKREEPKKTANHPQWYRLINNKLECQIG